MLFAKAFLAWMNCLHLIEQSSFRTIRMCQSCGNKILKLTCVVEEGVNPPSFDMLPHCEGCRTNAGEILQVAIDRFNCGFGVNFLQIRFSLFGTFTGSVQQDNVGSILASGSASHNVASARSRSGDDDCLAFQGWQGLFKVGKPLGFDGMRFGTGDTHRIV